MNDPLGQDVADPTRANQLNVYGMCPLILLPPRQQCP